MPTSGPVSQTMPAQTPERGAALALLPITVTVAYYVLPAGLRENTLIQFSPQAVAYLACAIWSAYNPGLISRFGLERRKFSRGLVVGATVGGLLGGLNAFIMLDLYPRAGFDITFLTTTPHGRLPMLLMVPWFITGIALFVELNFRGFLLGRLLALAATVARPDRRLVASSLALGISALVFSFDPFMVHTFRHLHWIAIWDGLVWGIMWLRMHNLYATIAAHAVEVLILYNAARWTLSL
ncbi:conserved membrane protein of unknown function [Nitrospira sp. KM1]|uniref:hypothetical protein n=1 Tax=Nitrospira sp. KM1 TaxID=1936990 RepID=UPI0013A72342|nr:hypothetical protein [Nitrospira sp. KM1]BCA54305.1 conserved membrane protein of unknown function [Nitrospira sp. KM1]